MKLVVCYGHGSEGSGCWTENICVEYESKDHFLVAFIDGFEAWGKRRKLENQYRSKIALVRASRNQDKVSAAIDEYSEFLKSKNSYDYDLIVDGAVFDYFEDYEYDSKTGEYTIISLPNVYDLDEWFELNRPKTIQGASK